MDTVALAIALSLLVLAGLVGVVARRRRVVDGGQSVQGYRRGIDTLRHMAEERARHPASQGQVPPSAGPPRTLTPPSPPTVEATAPAASDLSPAPAPKPLEKRESEPAVAAVPDDAPVAAFDDLAPRVRNPQGPVDPARIVHTLAARGSLYGTKPARRVTLPSRRPLPGTAIRVVALAAALVVVAGAAALGVGLGTTGHRAAQASHQAIRPAVRPSSGQRSVPITLTPTAATTSTATYEVPTTADVVELTASGPCWVEATDKATGALLWMGTLSAGQSHSFPAAGTILIRLGQATNVTLAVSGTPVQLPAGFHSVFEVTFQAA